MNPRMLQVPLEFAKHPSLAVRMKPDPLAPGNLPRLINVSVDTPQQIGLSGVMGSGTYGLNGDIYQLRVVDLQGLIHVNDGVEQGPQGSVSRNLERILNNLGNIVGVPELGAKILAKRPPGGYRSKGELLACVNRDEKIFKKFRDFVTVQAWQDAKVSNPVPLSREM